MKNFSLHNLLTAWALAQKRVFLRKLSCACAHAPPSSLSPLLSKPKKSLLFFPNFPLLFEMAVCGVVYVFMCQ